MTSNLNNLFENIDTEDYTNYRNHDPLVSGKLNLVKFKDIKPIFSFEYINLNSQDNGYRFEQGQPHIHDEDYLYLLKKLNEISKKNICDIISKEDNKKVKYDDELHPTVSDYFQKTFKKTLNPTQFPSMIHFHLDHTRDNFGDRNTETKRVVIHGFIAYDRIYILFYDPYHELHS